MRYTDRLPFGAPVIVSCGSGVAVGRLNGGDGVIVLTDWMWLRADDDILDCPSSNVVIIGDPSIVMLIDEETFGRLTD